MTSERREFARLLRKQPTKAENILWERLRGSAHGCAYSFARALAAPPDGERSRGRPDNERDEAAAR